MEQERAERGMKTEEEEEESDGLERVRCRKQEAPSDH